MADTVKPRKICLGSTIGIIAPAGPPKSDRLKRGLRFLHDYGYKTKIYSQVRRKHGYLAGDDHSRAAAINEAFADPTVDGIFAARGGYGCLRILDKIDYEVIKRNPKLFIGYSDLTVLLLSIYNKCGLTTFHGPMVAIEFGRPVKEYTARHFFNVIEGNALDTIKMPSGYKIKTILGGKAEGTIVGGNLSLIARMVGTGYIPSFEGKIVFLEDTEEEPYRLDAYLAQLFMATDIKNAAGFILGEFTRTMPKYGGYMKGWNVLQVMKDYFNPLKKPVIYGFPCGHGREKITIPIGIRVALDSGKKTVKFLESGVV